MPCQRESLGWLRRPRGLRRATCSKVQPGLLLLFLFCGSLAGWAASWCRLKKFAMRSCGLFVRVIPGGGVWARLAGDAMRSCSFDPSPRLTRSDPETPSTRRSGDLFPTKHGKNNMQAILPQASRTIQSWLTWCCSPKSLVKPWLFGKESFNHSIRLEL